MKPAALAFVLAALAAASSADALLARPDRDDEEYRELATRYPAAVRLPGAGASGILVAPRWVLTAAAPVGPFAASPGKLAVEAGGRAYPVQAIFRPDGPDPDVALVQLREPVDGIEPVRPWRRDDEAGTAVRVVGFGAAGPVGGRDIRDGKARAGVNTIDRVEARHLGIRLKGTDDASDLQGALADGDLGAPALVEVEGQAFVAGIAVARAQAATRGPTGGAGDWERYARVSILAAWIDAVTFRAAAEEAAAAVGGAESR
jgi:hypothetical protein